MRMSAPISGKLPMHASGACKALLAALPKSQRLSLLQKQKLHAYTVALFYKQQNKLVVNMALFVNNL